MNERPGPPRRVLSRPPASNLSRVVVALVLSVLGVLGLGAGSAHAENTVVNSSPENGISVSQSPTEIVIGFTEELGEANTIALDCDAVPVTLPPTEVLDDGKTLSVAVPEPIAASTCTARWAVSNSDGEPNGRGVIAFVIQNDAPVGSVETPTDQPADATVAAPADATTGDTTGDTATGGTATSEPAVDGATSTSTEADVVNLSIAGRGHAAVWLGRLLSTLGIATLFGALLIIAAAWPEGVEYLVTVKFLRAVWVIAMIGTLLFVATASAVVTPEGGGSGFSPGTWLDLVDAGWAGRALLLRLVLLIASAWVAFRPDRAIDPTTQLAALGIPGLCAALIGVSRTVGDLAALGVLVGMIHALAMSIWVGGVILLARVVLSGPGDEDLVHAVRGFGRVSTPAIAVTIITGIIQMIRLDGGDLFSTGHGRVVVLKAIVVAVMIFVAISARQFVAQRLNRAQQMSVPLADRLRRAFGAEAGIGVATLALSAWLLAFNPIGIDTADAVNYDVTQTHTVETADLEVVVRLTDAEIGLVGLEVEVKRPETGLSGLTLTLTAPPNDQNLGSIRQVIPLTGEGFAIRDETVGLPISVAGDWTIEIDATTASGAVSSTPQTYQVFNSDGSVASTEVTTPPVETVIIPDSVEPVSTDG